MPERMSRLAVPIVLLAALAAQLLDGMRVATITSDEVSHLPAGMTYVGGGDRRLNPQHPPLVKLLAGLATLPMRPTLDFADPGWTSNPPDEWGFGYRTFWSQRDPDALLFAARLPVAALTLLGALAAWGWSRERFGDVGAAGTLLLLVASPTFVAHGALVTMDAAAAATTVGTFWLLHRWASAPSAARAAALGIALGLALGAKFSCALLVPIVLGVLAWRRAWTAAAWTAASAVLVVWGFYGFPADSGFYLEGLRRVNADRASGYAYYLAGRFDPAGFPHYFLAAFLLKTPIPVLAAFGASWCLVRRASLAADALWILPAAAWFLATSRWADDIGVRYLLPLYPLLAVGAGRLLPWMLGNRGGRAIVAVGAIALAVGAWRSHPDQLAYFNEAAGGPSNGWRWLDDSNVDWGQDLKRLRRWMDDHDVPEIRFHYFGNGNPDHYGIRAVPIGNAEIDAPRPAPGWYAVSTHLLIRAEQRARLRGTHGDWLRRYRPVARIGYSIYIFRF